MFLGVFVFFGGLCGALSGAGALGAEDFEPRLSWRVGRAVLVAPGG